MRVVRRALQRVFSSWIDAQVELHGEYSLERLRLFDAYAKTIGVLRVLATCLLSPLPCLVLITLIDCVPLADPKAGTNANYVHWIRNFFTVVLITFSVMVQFKHTVPGLPITHTRMFMLSVLPSIAGVGTQYALSLVVGFPLPFGLIMGTPPWSVVIVVLFAHYFGDLLRSSAQFRADLSNYMFVFLCQISLTIIYPAYIYGFVSIDPSAQTLYVVLLPILKIALKNWISKFLGDLDDLKPEIVIFNIEIFNALYVACCMQQSSSITTTLVISVIDLSQALLSLRDIVVVHQDVQAFMALIPPTHAWHGKTFVEVALAIIDEDEAVRTSPLVRQACTNTGSAVLSTLVSKKSASAIVRRLSLTTSPAMGAATTTRIVPVTAAAALSNESSAAKYTPASDGPKTQDQATCSSPSSRPQPLKPTNDITCSDKRVQFVKQTNQLLFTTEFVVLIEYTEVIVPIIYSLYVVAVYHLENRTFYSQLAGMDDAELQRRISNVMIYSSLELLSFLLMSVTLRRRLGVATFKQLTLVLEKQWVVVQCKLLLWFFYAVQTSLDHFGADYSFKFLWLRQPLT